MIDPNEIPIPGADPDAVEDAGRALKNDGVKIAQTGNDVDTDWQGLKKFYTAPEENLLFAATAPIAAAGEDFKDDVTTVGTALVTFAGEIRPLITRLKNLKTDAQQFRSDIAGDDDWRKDEDKVNEHNQLNDDVLAAVAQYQEAERECANKITGIFGGTKFVPADGDPKSGEKGYGLDEAPEGVETPWATPQEYDAPWYEDAWNGVKDFGMGIVTDLADLVGLHGENGWVWEEDSHFWSNLGNNWMGVLEDTAGLVGLHGENGWVWEEDSHFWSNLGHNWTEVAHSFVPWREWDDRPGYVITSSILNIGSIFIGVGAVRGGLKLIKRGDADTDTPDRTHGDRDGDGRLDSDEIGFDQNPSTTDLQNQLDGLDIDTGDIQDALDDMDDLQDAQDRQPANVGGNDEGGQDQESAGGSSNGGDSGDGPPNNDPPGGNGNPPDGEGDSPDGEGDSPDGEGDSPDGEGDSPDGEGDSPDGEGDTPDGEGDSPDGEGDTPEGEGESPDGEGDGNGPEDDGDSVYSGGLEKVAKPDADADALAERLGGESRVKFKNDPSNREFDAVSDEYVAQTKVSTVTVNKKFRAQAKATFEAAQDTGRNVYYHFEGGPPSPDVIRRLEEYAERYEVDLVIDTTPLS